MTQAVHELMGVRSEVYRNLGTPVDLGADNERELRESYIKLTDEIDMALGRRALFALEPDMLHVERNPDAPDWEQGELFYISTTERED